MTYLEIGHFFPSNSLLIRFVKRTMYLIVKINGASYVPFLIVLQVGYVASAYHIILILEHNNGR